MDGAAAGATFYQPRSITADNINIYIADEMNHTIRQQVIATGVVSTLAGTTGVQGVADGTGTAATFSRPYGITTDGINLYVTDMNNYKIRKIVIATGVVTSLTGVPNTVMTAGSTDGTAMAARFDLLSSITTDGTSLYVADRGNNKIRKVVIATGIVSSQTGTVNAPMNEGSADGPAATATFGNAGLRGITTDGANLYVSDSKNNKIRKIVLATGVVSTLAGNLIPGAVDGTGAAASFSAPFGLTTDGTNLYIADAANYKIRQVVLATGAVTSLTGIPNTAGPRTVIDSTGSASTFDLPSDVTTDGTSLYVMDTGGQKIRKIQ